MWLKLCQMGNPHPIHLLTPPFGGGSVLGVATIQAPDASLSIDLTGSMVAAESYPAGTRVGNQTAGVDATLEPNNEWPWCVDATSQFATPAWLAANPGLPLCPASVSAAAAACKVPPAPAYCIGNDAANAWAVRGAINAGLAVYLYAESIENTGPAPDYNQCSLLK
jgi:hypothetical protein